MNLVKGGKAPAILRALLDKPYDVSTFLRQPSPYRQVGKHGGMPRERMLDRYEALMRHVMLGPRSYAKVVFVAHSQGTVLTTTLLAENPGPALPRAVSLLTFGCPLRQLYLRRFPGQYKWVAELNELATRCNFVTRVNREWVNVATAGDPIGRTVFADPPARWTPGRELELPGEPGTEPPRPALTELLLGRGGHGDYWTDPVLYAELARLIES
jgi:pimeloyl-ACP methyl ester carboxylesterase